MKYKKARPVLVETVKKTNLIINSINDRLIQDIETIIIENAKYQHLYIISIDLGEKIKEGDYITDGVKIYKAPDIDGFIGLYKIIACTDPDLNLPQPSSEYIQKFIIEYNNESVNDIDIEYDTFYELNDPTGKYTSYEPKLTNKYITIKEPEPILYTEEEVLELLKLRESLPIIYEQPITRKRFVGYVWEYQEPIGKWFNDNKKK